MLFSSSVFLFLFLPVVLLVYYLPLRRWRQGQNVFLLLASLGGALGCVIGIGVTAGMAAANGWPFSLPVIAVVGGLGVTIVIGALAGVYPAVRASRTPPTAALNAQ